MGIETINIKNNNWQNLIESTDSFTSDFMDERNQPV
jgi:hypothetical protein